MNNGTAWMIGASAIGVVLVCSGLGGVGFYLVSQRAIVEQARMQDEAQRAQAQAQEQVLAAQQAQAEALVQAQQAQAVAQAQAAQAQALAQGAGDPTVPADRSEAARQAVLRSRGQVRRCYEQLLRQNAGVSVRTTVELVFAPDGRVSSVTSRIDEATPADLETTAFSRCVEATFRGLAIPSGLDPLTISLPLVFAS